MSVDTITGASACLLYGDNVVAFLRDNRPDVPYANHWDFPGGALESGETPLQGVIREIHEETGLVLADDAVLWECDYPFTRRAGIARFVVMQLTTVELLKLGNEGQEVRVMAIAEFLSRLDIVPDQQDRLKDYLSTLATSTEVA